MPEPKGRIGVTGATGLVGRRLVKIARDEGYDIRCLVRLRPGAESGVDLIADGADVVQGSLADKDALSAFVQDLDWVVHLAAQVEHGSYEDYRSVNVQGTVNICAAISQHSPQCRLLYCSSVAVLRRYRTLPWLNTAYTRSKAEAERRVRFLARDAGLQVTYLYPGMVYGPTDARFLPALVRALRSGGLVNVTGGERWAPLIYLDDLCEFILQVLSSDDPAGRSYIGVGRQEAGMHDLVRLLAVRLGVSPPKVTLPKSAALALALLFEGVHRLLGRSGAPSISRRAVDVLSINLDPRIVRAANRGEWEAGTSLANGLDRTFEWLALSGAVPGDTK